MTTPDVPAERDAYRCKGCGEWFDDDNGGRHAAHDAGCDGSCRYCPVPCGPIVLYERATPSAPQEAREPEAIERPCGCEDAGRLRFTAREWLRAWHKAGVRELLGAPGSAEVTEASEKLPEFLRCLVKTEDHGVMRQCVKAYEHEGEHEAHGLGGVIRWAEATERSEP